MKWPEQLPVLKPEDFVIGPYDCGSRFCLIGWTDNCFPGVAGHVMAQLFDTCDDLNATGITLTSEPDTPANRRLAARIWAKFIKRLGYTEDGPTVEM